MSISEEEFQRYIQKALEIQRQKKDHFITNKDLDEIAREMGIAKEDILAAWQRYLAQGEGYLKHHNWTDALNAFEQALVLSPQHEPTLLGLVKAHKGLWETTNKVFHKEEALRLAKTLVDLHPKNKEAYYLISELKRTEKTTVLRPNTPVSKNKRTVVTSLVLFIFMFTVGIVTFFLMMPSKTSTSSTGTNVLGQEKKFGSITASTSVISSQGPVVWIVDYDQQGGGTNDRTYDYRITILDPATQEEKTTINLLQKTVSYTESVKWGQLYVAGDAVFWVDGEKKKLEERDGFTGKVKGDNNTLKDRFKILQQEGIGIVEETYSYAGGLLFEITTEQGNIFYYFPEKQRLLSEEDYNTSRRKPTESIQQYVWRIEKDGKKKMFSLVTLQQPSFGALVTRERYRVIPRNEGSLLSDLNGKTFLEATLLYGDKKRCIIKSYKKIGDSEYDALYTCLNIKGEVLWEKSYPEAEVLKHITEGVNTFGNGFVGKKYQNQVVIGYSDWIETPRKQHCYMFCALDYNTGNLLWEYSPDCAVGSKNQ
ncbi:MAG: tetratricopeptide repeat protein [Thermonemataceae bacterium]